VFRRLLVPLLAALVLLAIPAAAPAKVNVIVGIGDQSPEMFTNVYYQQLQLKRTRYFIEWDAIDKPVELAQADKFVNAANAAGVKTLLHISTSDLRPKKAKLPSVASYRAKVGALVAHYRAMGITDWGVWNEANHVTQPTYKSPRRAASFYKAFRKFRCAGCKIVALDVLDQAGVERYVKRWLSAAGSAGRKAKVIGIHNYSEVNRLKRKGTNKYPGTKRIVDAVRKKNRRARYWYTETGALVKFQSFHCSTSRPKKTLRFMFSLTKKYDRYIERLYSYNWSGADCQVRFDAGLVNANGTPRPHYAIFKSKLKDYKR
jgi:hypothetical protein